MVPLSTLHSHCSKEKTGLGMAEVAEHSYEDLNLPPSTTKN
jgi:hypothetical protein